MANIFIMQGPFCDTLRLNFELSITIITILALLAVLWCYNMSVKQVGYDQCIVLLFSPWEGARVLNNYCCLLYFWHILLQFYMIRPIVLLLIMKLGIRAYVVQLKFLSENGLNMNSSHTPVYTYTISRVDNQQMILDNFFLSSVNTFHITI